MRSRLLLPIIVCLLAGGAPGVGLAEWPEAPGEPPDGLAPELAPSESDSAHDGGRSDDPIPRGSVPLDSDVRVARAGSVAEFWAELPGTRRVGSGWIGHRTSVARSVVPASLTSVSLGSRRWDDWITSGLDVFGASLPSAAAILVPGGPDLSIWPSYAASGLAARSSVGRGGPAAHSIGLSVDLEPLRAPGRRPFARLTMGEGHLGWRATAVEFSRTYKSGVALSGLFDDRSGRAPVPGGSHDAQSIGALVGIGLESGWTVRLSGCRTELQRGIPFGDDPQVDRSTEYIRSDVDIVAENGPARVQLYRGETWLGTTLTGSPDRAVRAAYDGAAASIPFDASPVDWVRVQLERRSARGSVLGGSRRAVMLELGTGRDLRLSERQRLLVSVGLTRMRGKLCPRACALLSHRGDRVDRWIGAELGGRHPTAAELFAESVRVPAAGGTVARISGCASLGPEKAVVLSAGSAARLPIAEVGAEIEIARVISPIVLASDGPEAAAVTAGGDDEVACLSLWGAAGDTSSAGVACVVDVLERDDYGALNASSPVGSVAVRGTAWLPLSLFGGQLETVCHVGVRHERGLADGPWAGLLDNTLTTVTAVVSGRVGSGRLYVEMNNVLDVAGKRLPYAPIAERGVTTGFSWGFWD